METVFPCYCLGLTPWSHTLSTPSSTICSCPLSCSKHHPLSSCSLCSFLQLCNLILVTSKLVLVSFMVGSIPSLHLPVYFTFQAGLRPLVQLIVGILFLGCVCAHVPLLVVPVACCFLSRRSYLHK